MIARSASTTKTGYEKFLRCVNCSDNRGIKLDIVEEEIINNLNQFVINYKADFNGIEYSNSNNDNLESLNKILRTLENEASTLVSQKENLHNLLEQGIYDIDTYLDRSKVLSDKIEKNKSDYD